MVENKNSMGVDLEQAIGAISESQLLALDAHIDALSPRLSLAPGRERATSLSVLARTAELSIRPTMRRVLYQIGAAQADAFPKNIFWDLDALAHSLRVGAGRSDRPTEYLSERGDVHARLQRLYGCGTDIGFAYVHDFGYGFDWVKWVRRAPGERAPIGPFDLEFLHYLLGRGQELLALIAENDEKYPALPKGATRNPFRFGREPEAEVALFYALRDQDLIPLKAWKPSGVADSSLDYQGRRETLALELVQMS